MKTLLTLVLALTFSQVYAQSSMSSGEGTGAASESATSGTIMNSNTNTNKNEPIFGSEVPDRSTTHKQGARTIRSKTESTSDTVGRTQSSTSRTTTKKRVIPITPSKNKAANCVDNMGRIFGTEDAGYTGCLNSMRNK